MNGNQMMGRRTGVPEKSKRGIKGVLKELFTYSSKLRLPMIIAFQVFHDGRCLDDHRAKPA